MAKRQKVQQVPPMQFDDEFEAVNVRPLLFDESELEETDVIESGAAFWRFEDDPEVVGMYQGPVIAREDKADMWSKGDTIGFLMRSAKGSEFILPANYAIEEAMQNAKQGEIFKVTFLGKETNSSGKPFSRFRIVKMKAKYIVSSSGN